MSIYLYDYQVDAIKRMKNGNILCGGVGSGKSRTALAYYYINENSDLLNNIEDIKEINNRKSIKFAFSPMKANPRDLYIITTARKRDSLEWEEEMIPFLLTIKNKYPEYSYYNHKVIIDSWNNIGKYSNVKDAFFIFDEQRVVGYGVWSKTFIKISKSNKWILLSATPGDKWEDYIPVFIANGFYRNKTEFINEHIVYSRYVKWKIDRYISTKRLIRQRDQILIDMDFHRVTKSHHEDIYVDYDKIKYKDCLRKRTDPYNNNEPIQHAGVLCQVLRHVVNESQSKQIALLEIFEKHPKMIIFYNFNYELEILKNLYYGENVEIAEWNGFKHQPVPDGESWVYLVQYTAGAEAWNCITTDTVVFYSENYSYKIMEQASGRIDRLDTPYTDLYYYHLKTRSSIDMAISRCLHAKKKFNERKFLGNLYMISLPVNAKT